MPSGDRQIVCVAVDPRRSLLRCFRILVWFVPISTWTKADRDCSVLPGPRVSRRWLSLRQAHALIGRVTEHIPETARGLPI